MCGADAEVERLAVLGKVVSQLSEVGFAEVAFGCFLQDGFNEFLHARRGREMQGGI